MSPGFLIVGGSYAAVHMAVGARLAGYPGAITLVHEERHAPYQRPPLSKEFLLGPLDDEALALHPADFYESRRIGRVAGARVTAIHPGPGAIDLDDGRRLHYEWLGLATGARARDLACPGGRTPGVFALRSRDDAALLAQRLRTASRVVVIGGGFIGLETAAAAVKLGKPVTLIETQPRLLARATGPLVSAFMEQLHRSHGVELMLGMQVDRIESTDGQVTAVRCADGTRLPADLVVAGVGSVPNDELARDADLATAQGVLVDRFGVTSNPRIVAAGDCARFWSPHWPSPLRLESVQNAIDQARGAGAWVAGQRLPHETVPWFWTVQHDCRLQMAGLRQPEDDTLVRGAPACGAFSVLYLREGVLVAAESVNRPADHIAARRLIAARACPNPDRASDPAVGLAAA